MPISVFRGIVRKTGPSLVLQEILYGFIMGLIFITAARIGILDYKDNINLAMLIIGMNLTWGAIDAIVFYMIDVFRQRTFLRLMNSSDDMDQEKRVDLIMDEFSGTPLDILDPECERMVCREILKMRTQDPEMSARDRRDMRDSSIGCFVVTALTILPLVLPILLIGDTDTGLMVSSMLSSIILFFVGFMMEPYLGVNRWVLGLFLAGVSWAITITATFTGG